jgi:spore coat polysaccharide biosynthesis predicted glycosyltransferase SpsG
LTRRVLVRCDATREIGLGHVSRCLALGEALAERGVGSVFCGEFDAPARHLLEEAGAPTEPGRTAEDVLELVRQGRFCGVVVDGYDFDAAYLAALAPSRIGATLLVVDDFAALAEYPDGSLVLNFTVGARALEYPGRGLVLLLGPEYLLVRRELRRLNAERPSPSRPARHILVALGGGDPLGLAVELAGMLSPEVAVRVASGSSGELPPAVEALADGQLAPGFAWADVCVTGGGLTKYEAAYVGVPPLVISQTDGEHADSKRFAHAGLGVDAGHGRHVEPHALRDTLRSFVRDAALHERLRQTAAATFPSDPTARVAEILVDAFE